MIKSKSGSRPEDSVVPLPFCLELPTWTKRNGNAPFNASTSWSCYPKLTRTKIPREKEASHIPVRILCLPRERTEGTPQKSKSSSAHVSKIPKALPLLLKPTVPLANPTLTLPLNLRTPAPSLTPRSLQRPTASLLIPLLPTKPLSTPLLLPTANLCLFVASKLGSKPLHNSNLVVPSSNLPPLTFNSKAPISPPTLPPPTCLLLSWAPLVLQPRATTTTLSSALLFLLSPPLYPTCTFLGPTEPFRGAVQLLLCLATAPPRNSQECQALSLPLPPFPQLQRCPLLL
mmetsp:Transcript_376/g.644  ORF Transcript_376/g.644 Transcript_376/m.644 type:complete len:287 (+) Transcript_376:472-1332(+)